MDSAPLPDEPPKPFFSLKPCSSASKLPIKRKTPDLSQSPDPKIESSSATTKPTVVDDDVLFPMDAVDFESKPAPFKFHRIWTESDEIRFLRGLLDSFSDGLSFPRDLPAFYDRFSNTMSQPYTKSQLSEKLRRLRKKFRVTSSRIAHGLNPLLLSSHDSALFDLSMKLWSPEFSSVSPFGGCSTNIGNSNLDTANCNFKSKNHVDGNLVAVKVSFSPVLPVGNDNKGLNDSVPSNLIDFDDVNALKISGVNVDCDMGVATAQEDDCGLAKSVVKSVLDAFDVSLSEIQKVFVKERLPCADDLKNGIEKDFERRWREQRAAEFDVLVRRLRLVLDNSLKKQ